MTFAPCSSATRPVVSVLRSTTRQGTSPRTFRISSRVGPIPFDSFMVGINTTSLSFAPKQPRLESRGNLLIQIKRYPEMGCPTIALDISIYRIRLGYRHLQTQLI